MVIRKNAKRILTHILSNAVLIREYRHDYMAERATVERVMSHAEDFERVSYEGGVLRISINRNWSFTAYDSVEVARRTLTERAFAEYFPNEV